MYVLFLIFLSYIVIFVMSLTFSTLIKGSFLKKLIVFVLSFFALKIFLPNYIISFFGEDLKPKKDLYPIIYSRSGVKLHIENVCNSRKLGDEIFLIPNIDINTLIDSNGKKIQCATHLDYDNNEIRFNDTHGSTIWLERDLKSFGYEYVEKKEKYRLYNKYDIGEARTPLRLPEKKLSPIFLMMAIALELTRI